jgi:hypothetical protein
MQGTLILRLYNITSEEHVLLLALKQWINKQFSLLYNIAKQCLNNISALWQSSFKHRWNSKKTSIKLIIKILSPLCLTIDRDWVDNLIIDHLQFITTSNQNNPPIYTVHNLLQHEQKFPKFLLSRLSCLMICSGLFPFLDHLCGLVVRVSGYSRKGPGFDSWRYQIF